MTGHWVSRDRAQHGCAVFWLPVGPPLHRFRQSLRKLWGFSTRTVFCDSQVRVIPDCSGTVVIQGCSGLLGCMQYRVFCSDLSTIHDEDATFVWNVETDQTNDTELRISHTFCCSLQNSLCQFVPHVFVLFPLQNCWASASFVTSWWAVMMKCRLSGVSCAVRAVAWIAFSSNQ